MRFWQRLATAYYQQIQRMILKKPLKTFLFPAANVLIGIFLLSAFFIAGQNVVQTFSVANITSLGNLQPQPTDYFLELNAHQSTPDKNEIHCYADYYEHMLEVFPNLWDAYGILGYCYHYLNDDPKAIKFLKIAIQNYPDYFWNYYNLAAVYVNESRYQEASDVLQKALNVPPMASLKTMFTSRMVYLPLLDADEKKSLAYTARHLKEMYRSCFVLAQILNQTGNSEEFQEVLRKFKPELYAF